MLRACLHAGLAQCSSPNMCCRVDRAVELVPAVCEYGTGVMFNSFPVPSHHSQQWQALFIRRSSEKHHLCPVYQSIQYTHYLCMALVYIWYSIKALFIVELGVGG